MIFNDLSREQAYSHVIFNLISYSVETPRLWNCMFSTFAEYWQRFAHVCNENATCDKIPSITEHFLWMFNFVAIDYLLYFRRPLIDTLKQKSHDCLFFEFIKSWRTTTTCPPHSQSFQREQDRVQRPSVNTAVEIKWIKTMNMISFPPSESMTRRRRGERGEVGDPEKIHKCKWCFGCAAVAAGHEELHITAWRAHWFMKGAEREPHRFPARVVMFIYTFLFIYLFF